ncbi:hypothetical protein SBF1_8390001 [Candidatus Desulfosporosinus infrequens]|uniref:Uncharacterized protein n=1 Tax=Candidatus Desulfosporosinus infrequens TaxID=2043169 RepID=A0A2U3LUK6_9FIRM|nr:hypothetical protein SBF1_8390001 [Candidatus Desulfosporosinus infrequens]
MVGAREHVEYVIIANGGGDFCCGDIGLCWASNRIRCTNGQVVFNGLALFLLCLNRKTSNFEKE